MNTSLRTSFLGVAYYRALQRHLVVPVQRLGLTPNQLTLVGAILACGVPFGFALHPFFGLFFLILSGVTDSLDGMMARHQNRVTDFGAFLDSSVDRLSDFFYLAGFWVLLWPHPMRLIATLLMFMATLLTLMISYVKARAEALEVQCAVGAMDRGVRVLFLIVWALCIVLFPSRMNAIVWIGFFMYIILTLETLVRRIRHARREMLAEASSFPDR